MKEKKVFVNWIYILGLFIGFLIGYFILEYLLQPILHSAYWVVLGSYLIALFVMTVGFSKISPVIVFVGKEGQITFVGIPWIYKFKRMMLDEIIIEPVGIIFKPKQEYTNIFRHVLEYTIEPYLGYKVIKFANYRAIGALIEALQPITGTDSLDKIKNPKWRKYLEEKVYRN